MMNWHDWRAEWRWPRGGVAVVCSMICAASGLGLAQEKEQAVRAGSTARAASTVRQPLLDKQRLLDGQTFWDNRDWDWYQDHIPFFECPDAEITTTYYYRWELLTKHLTYGSPNSGYSFTEFIDRPFWSGAYGAISCPAGHQLYEARWLRRPRIARDYARYWLRTPGAQPRRYSTWLADATWAVHEVHPDSAWMNDLLPELIRNFEGWEQRHWVPEVGLYWQVGHDDGMEFNINSRQTKDILRGAPGYRPSFNAYLWADAQAIARAARLAGDQAATVRFTTKAAGIKEQMQRRLWDPQREFYFPMFKDDEERDGFRVKALTLTHQSGQFAGSPHGRELIGYVPWQFNMPDRGHEAAWKFLMDREYFFAEFGPTTVERRDPMYYLSKSCCWWSGQSWPYATTQTLKALANLLQNYDQKHVTSEDYVKLLGIFARTHRKDGRPYLAEACHPDTGSFDGHDGYNHSEHYFHSAYCDLVITGLVGLKTRDDDTLEVHPLAPASWPYFALDDVMYRGRRVSVIWDAAGDRYGLGRGLRVIVDGQVLAESPRLERLTAKLPPPAVLPLDRLPTAGNFAVNFAVNNDGTYYPRIQATYSHPQSSVAKVIDGNYWYHRHPPNRWTSEGSPQESDALTIDFGVARTIHTVKLYLLDDRDNADGHRDEKLASPSAVALEGWNGEAWQALPILSRSPDQPTGHRANGYAIRPTSMSRLRVTLAHAPGTRSGLTEIEAWGDARLPLSPAPPPVGNLAYRDGRAEFPKASASHTSRFDKVEWANDGIVSFAPNPHNRWTSYESKAESDWLEIDFGRLVEFRRVELAVYDDRGGVQAPRDYAVQYWSDDAWQDVESLVKSPANPVGGQWNEARFAPVKSAKVRIVFTHRGPSRSGVSEILVWNE